MSLPKVWLPIRVRCLGVLWDGVEERRLHVPQSTWLDAFEFILVMCCNRVYTSRYLTVKILLPISVITSRCTVRWGWTEAVTRSSTHVTCRVWRTTRFRRCSVTRTVSWWELDAATTCNRTACSHNCRNSSTFFHHACKCSCEPWRGFCLFLPINAVQDKGREGKRRKGKGRKRRKGKACLLYTSDAADE